MCSFAQAQTCTFTCLHGSMHGLLRFLDLDWNHKPCHWLSGASSLHTADHGTSQPHNHVSQSLIINLLLYSILILLLWRTPANTALYYYLLEK